MTVLDASLQDFLTAHAESLDVEATHGDAVLTALGTAGLLRRGVPVAHGGDGQPQTAAVEAIAAVAEQSLAAAFMFWGQRCFIEYVLQGESARLRGLLPELLSGRHAGATGLSNAMKFLSGIEALRLRAQTLDGTPGDGAGRWRIEGDVPWATNLRPAAFHVAVAVERAQDGPFIAALSSAQAGVRRSADLDLIALRGSHTASVQVHAVDIDADDVIAADAKTWLPRVRPGFLAMQCGLSIGLTRGALAAARAHGAAARQVLDAPITELLSTLERVTAELLAGLTDGRFVTQPVPLFELRIALADLVQQALQLELQASGGRAYHRDQPLGFARRWREAAFIPIVTPSITQLRGELLRRAAQSRAQG